MVTKLSPGGETSKEHKETESETETKTESETETETESETEVKIEWREDKCVYLASAPPIIDCTMYVRETLYS